MSFWTRHQIFEKNSIFLVIGILGGREVVAHPGVLQALSPVWWAAWLAPSA